MVVNSKQLYPLGFWLTERQRMMFRGVLHHLQNAKYFSSMKPFSEGEPGSLPIPSMGLVYIPTFTITINHSCR